MRVRTKNFGTGTYISLAVISSFGVSAPYGLTNLSWDPIPENIYSQVSTSTYWQEKSTLKSMSKARKTLVIHKAGRHTPIVNHELFVTTWG